MKPERYVRRKAWTANARAAGQRWRSYLALLAGGAVFAAFFATWPHMPLGQVFVGMTLGAVAMAAVLSAARFDDPVVRGDLAEQWSADAFGKVRGWQVINNLAFYDGDLDHVVITPSGVLGVETKYRYRQQDARRLALQRWNDIETALRAGQKVASLLRSKHVEHEASVASALIVWGPGHPELPDGYKLVTCDHGAVYVLDGDHPALWSTLFNAPLLPADVRSAIHDSLVQYQRGQADDAARRLPPMRLVVWREFWAGVAEERRERGQLAARKDSIRRRHGRHDAQVPEPASAPAGHDSNVISVGPQLICNTSSDRQGHGIG